MKTLSLRLPDDLARRIESELDGRTWQRWIVRACERELNRHEIGRAADVPSLAQPAPYRQGYGPNVENIRSSAQSKRDVRPVPKGKS